MRGTVKDWKDTADTYANWWSEAAAALETIAGDSKPWHTCDHAEYARTTLNEIEGSGHMSRPELTRRIMVAWSARDQQVTIIDPDLEPSDESVLFGIRPEEMDGFIQMLRQAVEIGRSHD